MADKTIVDAGERVRKAAAARARFHQATLKIATEHRFGGPDMETSELEIMEEATRLLKEARIPSRLV